MLVNKSQKFNKMPVFWEFWCKFCAKRPFEAAVTEFNDLRTNEDLYGVAVSCFANWVDDKTALPTCAECEQFISDLHQFSLTCSKTHTIFSDLRKKRWKRMNVDPVLEPEPEQEPEPEPELEVEPQEEIIGHSEVIDDKADVYEIIIPNEEYEQGEEEEEDEKEFIITHGGEEVKEEDEHILIFEEELAEDDDDLIEELVDDSDQPLVKIEQKSRKKRQRKVREKKRPFVCDDCGKTWSTRGALKEHQIIHSDDRPFQCSQCPKSFKNQQRLRIHEDIHNDTAYICPECGLQLNTKRTLTMHMVVHSEEKRFKCEFCGNEYKRAKALKAHLVIHTGMRPYKCPFCDKTFVNGSNCRTHKRKAHPESLAALEAAIDYADDTKAKVLPNIHELRSNLKINGIVGVLE